MIEKISKHCITCLRGSLGYRFSFLWVCLLQKTWISSFFYYLCQT